MNTTRTFPPRRVRASRALLQALDTLGGPGDAYRLARLTGETVMDTGRLLEQLEQLGWVNSADPTGTINDLARRFTRVPAPIPTPA